MHGTSDELTYSHVLLDTVLIYLSNAKHISIFSDAPKRVSISVFSTINILQYTQNLCDAFFTAVVYESAHDIVTRVRHKHMLALVRVE